MDDRPRLQAGCSRDSCEITRTSSRRYGELFVELRAAGTSIPVNDIWIAAATIDAGAELITFDTDFQRIARLERTILVP